MEENPKNNIKEEVLTNKLWAAFSYWNILVLLPFLFKIKNPFVVFHAKQGLIIFITECLLVLISTFPIIGWIIALIGWIFCAIVSLIGFIKALHYQYWNAPFFHQYTKKINF